MSGVSVNVGMVVEDKLGDKGMSGYDGDDDGDGGCARDCGSNKIYGEMNVGGL